MHVGSSIIAIATNKQEFDDSAAHPCWQLAVHARTFVEDLIPFLLMVNILSVDRNHEMGNEN